MVLSHSGLKLSPGATTLLCYHFRHNPTGGQMNQVLLELKKMVIVENETVTEAHFPTMIRSRNKHAYIREK